MQPNAVAGLQMWLKADAGIVTDGSGVVIYTLGSDYNLIPRGDRVEIDRVLGGRIPNGGPVPLAHITADDLSDDQLAAIGVRVGRVINKYKVAKHFALTISAALLLIATTSFPGICRGLRRLGLPALFVSQLLFLYRYLFVLMEEAMRVVRARDMRSFGTRGTGARVFVRIVGTLFLRTVERAERIYGAMLARGFRGDLPSMRREALRPSDAFFVLAAAGFFALCRFVPVPQTIGRLVRGLAG